jgi:hypothetical protein
MLCINQLKSHDFIKTALEVTTQFQFCNFGNHTTAGLYLYWIVEDLMLHGHLSLSLSHTHCLFKFNLNAWNKV